MNDYAIAEEQYIATLFNLGNDGELMNEIRLLPHYFQTKEYKDILTSMINFYKKEKTLNIVGIWNENKEVDFDMLVDLFTNSTYCLSIKSFRYLENHIIENYKNEISNKLEEQKKNGSINFKTFAKKIKELDDIKVNDFQSRMITTSQIDIFKTEEKIFIKSGIKKLDELIGGFLLNDISVWSGGNASSKSTFLNQIALESINQGYNVALFSGELTAKRLFGWLCNQSAGIENMSYNRESGYYYVDNIKKQKIANWLNNKLFIYDNNFGNKADLIIDSVIETIIKNNVKVIILDNLMSIDITSNDANKYDAQSNFIQKLCDLAKKYNVHIHFVCHPRKATNFLRKIDISGTADLTNKADNVFIMHRVNQDFKNSIKETYKLKDDDELFDYSNVVEICKNRDRGIMDSLVGMFFNIPSKQLLNYRNEKKIYKWEENE